MQFFRRKKTPEAGVVDIPPKALQGLTRQSKPIEKYAAVLGTKLNAVKPSIPASYIGAIELLSIANPDVGQAVTNAITLGNTGHFVEIETSGKRDSKIAADIVKNTAQRVYPLSAGVDGLVDALLGQLARTGAISAEIVFHENWRDGIKEVVLVPVKTVVWMRDKETKELTPYQDISGSPSYLPSGDLGNFIKLNPLTFVYYKLDSLEDSPYSIPPYASALNNLSIQMDMMKNLSSVVRKVGLVGFISVLINAPQLKKGETQEVYHSRLATYLDTASEQIENNYNDGIFVGFKGQHEVSMQSVVADLRGVDSLMQVNEEQVFSGLKSDPAMHGRTYSTTETYAGVVFDKLMASLESYRRLIKRFLERMYTMELRCRGVSVTNVKVTFKPYKPMNEYVSQQAKQLKFQNATADYEAGMISWEDYARMLGYDSPYRTEKEAADIKAKKFQDMQGRILQNKNPMDNKNPDKNPEDVKNIQKDEKTSGKSVKEQVK